MMGKFKVEATLPMNAATYWHERDTPAFRAFQCKLLDLKSIEMVEQWVENEQPLVKLRTVPSGDLPGPIKSLLGGREFVFDDVLKYPTTMPPFRLEFKTFPPVLPNKLSIGGVITIEVVDDKTCKQVLEGYCDANIFGIGGIVEHFIVDGLKKTYAKLPDVVKRWNEVRPVIGPPRVGDLKERSDSQTSAGTRKSTVTSMASISSVYFDAKEDNEWYLDSPRGIAGSILATHEATGRSLESCVRANHANSMRWNSSFRKFSLKIAMTLEDEDPDYVAVTEADYLLGSYEELQKRKERSKGCCTCCCFSRKRSAAVTRHTKTGVSAC
eukprot:Colp12_sorted_trinity150504_noHs@6651